MLAAAMLFAALLTAAVSAADISASRAALDEKYVQHLGKFADQLESQGLKREAQITRHWFIRRQRDRNYLFLVPESDPPAPAKDASDKVQAWYAKFRRDRAFYAKYLFELAEKALDQDQPAAAYALVHEVLREYPDHPRARAILDYEKVDGRWCTTFAKRQRQRGNVDHPKFGWLPPDHVARYNAGQRRYAGRWITAEEEDRLRGRSIEAGWPVETDHFLISTNHSLEAGVELGRRLEELHTVWRQLFAGYWFTETELQNRFEGKPSARAEPKHKVVLFRNKQQYVDHLGRDAPGIERSLGFYSDHARTAYFYAGDERALATWFHEATHQLFHERRRRARPVGMDNNFWAAEGIALYMESLRRHDGYYTVGGFDAERMQFARYRALNERFFVPTADLVRLGREEVQKDANVGKLYSQSAGLAHLLMDYEGGRHRQAFVGFLSELYRDRTDAASLAGQLKLPYAELDQQYARLLNVTDADLQQIAPRPALKRLCLGHTAVTDAGMSKLAGLPQLQWLDLAHTKVGDAGLAALDDAPALAQLNLERTQITDASLRRIGRLTTLTELDLSACRISDAGLAHLAGLKNLQVLWLTGTPITDAGLKHLHGLKELTFLDTDGTRVTGEGWKDLKRSVPGVSNSN